MKVFIYLSVLLITAGSAFGLVDYIREKNKGTLDRLYTGIAAAQPAVTAKTAVTGSPEPLPAVKTDPAAVKTGTVVAAKKKEKKKTRMPVISFKEFSRAAPPRPPAEPAEEPLPPPPPPPPVQEGLQPAVTSASTPAAEKKRSLRKLFSRAAPERVKEQAGALPAKGNE